eukprot:SAG22_NODE_862_length_6808_cov_3.881204_8_plen_111_part_00
MRSCTTHQLEPAEQDSTAGVSAADSGGAGGAAASPEGGGSAAAPPPDPKEMLAQAQAAMSGLGGKTGEDQVAAAMRALELMTSAVRQQSGEDGVMEMLKQAKANQGGGQL